MTNWSKGFVSHAHPVSTIVNEESRKWNSNILPTSWKKHSVHQCNSAKRLVWGCMNCASGCYWPEDSRSLWQVFLSISVYFQFGQLPPAAVAGLRQSPVSPILVLFFQRRLKTTTHCRKCSREGWITGRSYQNTHLRKWSHSMEIYMILWVK